jgi:hypothetical protein
MKSVRVILSGFLFWELFFVIKNSCFSIKKPFEINQNGFLLFTQTLQVTEFTVFSAKAKVNR